MDKHKYRELKTQKQFLKLFFADIISRFGDSLDTIAYSWIIYEITGSSALMALIVGLNYIPTVIIMPFAGTIVDILPKKIVMCISDVLRFIIVSAIIILYITNSLNVGVLVIATLLTSTVEAFRVPASASILTMLLDKNFYKLGKGASYSSQRTAELIGFILSGSIIATFGVATALKIDAITFLLSTIIIATIKYTDVYTKMEITVTKVISNFKVGVSFFKNNHSLKILLLLGIFVNVGSMSLGVFQTPYVAEHMQMEEEALSYIKIAMTIGMMIGAFIVPKIRKLKNSSFASISGILMGITIFSLGILPLFEKNILVISLILVGMFSMGFCGGMLNVVVSSSFMKIIPQNIMGRVLSVVSSLMTISLPLTSFLCSLLAIKLEITTILIIFGVIATILHLLLLFSKKLKIINN